MSKWKDLNMPLRNFVLSHAIRQEQTSSEIIKALLRILKPKTKTLSNKSSSLSFKNKIDLLYDMEELSNEEYNHILKFMEIRNQFIHNHECSSFIKLGESNPDLTKYLKKYFPNEIQDEEKSLLKSYEQLFIVCQGRLLVMEREFTAGITADYEKYVANQLYNRFDEVIEKAKQKLRENNAKRKLAFIPTLDNGQSSIDSFILALNLTISETRIEILDELEGEKNMTKAFKRKISIDELLKKSSKNEISDKQDKKE